MLIVTIIVHQELGTTLMVAQVQVIIIFVIIVALERILALDLIHARPVPKENIIMHFPYILTKQKNVVLIALVEIIVHMIILIVVVMTVILFLVWTIQIFKLITSVRTILHLDIITVYHLIVLLHVPLERTEVALEGDLYQIVAMLMQVLYFIINLLEYVIVLKVLFVSLRLLY